MSFAPKQFIRSVDFLSTENATNTSTGSVNIYGGMSVSKDSYLTNMIVVGNSTLANVNITGALTTSNGNSLISSQWTSIDSNTDIYFGTSANSFVGIGTTTPGFNLDISGGSRITGGLTVGNLNVNTGASITNILNTTICTGTVIVTAGSIRASFNSHTIGSLVTTGGNVGIGTTAPGSRLEVNGTLKANDITVGNINFTGNLFQNGTAYLGSQWTTTAGNTLTYTSGNVSVNSGFTSSFNSNTLGSIITTGGNVGIGTSSPSSILHLQSTNVDTILNMTCTTSGSNTFIFNSPATSRYADLYFSPDESIYFRQRSGGTYPTRLIINTAGNIGMGTTTPTTTLDVSGTARITTSLTTGALFSTNQTTTNIVATNSTFSNIKLTDNSAINLDAVLEGRLALVKKAGSLPAIAIANNSDMYFQVANNTDASQVTTNTYTTIMQLKTSGQLLISSLSSGNIVTTNITIGSTTTIQATTNNYSLTSGALNITGDIVLSGNEIMFTTTGVGAPILNGRGSGSKIVLYPETGATRGDYSIGVESAYTWFQVPSISSHGFKFYQGTTANVIINPGGSVNILNTANITTISSGSLFLSGNLSVAGTLTTVNITSTNLVNTNVSAGVVVASTLLSATGNSNTIGNVIYTTGGSVGMGTIPTTNTLLHLFTSDATNTLFVENNGGGSGFQPAIRAKVNALSAARNILQLENTSGIQMIFRDDGRLGIGTTAPTAQLNINNDFSISANNAAWNTTAGKGIFMRYSTNSGQDSAYIQSMDRSTSTVYPMTLQARSLTFSVDANGTSKMFINTSGNIGIGTTTPSRMLSLNGPTTNITAGPHLWINTSDQANPVFQMLNWSADNVSMNFDMYYDGSFRNSGSSTAWQIYKSNSQIRFMYQNGTAGSSNGQTNCLVLGSTGNVGIMIGNGIHLHSASSINNGTYSLHAVNSGSYPIRLALTDDAALQRPFEIGYYTSNNSTSTWNSKFYVNGYSGNVGIGTQSPAYTLDISGTTKVTNTSSTSMGTFIVSGPNSSSPATATSGQLASFYGAGGSGAISNIDLSTYLPGTTTNNLPAVRFSMLDLGAANSTFNILTRNSGSTGTMGSRIFIDGSGNIGIGTTSPQTKLHVEDGSVFIGDASAGFSTSVPSSPGWTNGSNGYRLFFDNSVNGTNGTGMPANKIVLHNNNWTCGFGVEVGGVTYHSGLNHKFYNGTSNSSTYGSLIFDMGGNSNIFYANTNGEASIKIVNSNTGSSAYSIFRLGNNVTDAVMFLNSSTRTTDGGANNMTIRNDAGALRLQGSGSNNTLWLSTGANIGIGTTTPSYPLHVSGDIYATGDVISFSDARLKTDVVTIENALDKVSGLRGVYYTNTNTNTRETGVIAQEIAEILPEVVADKGEYLGVAYGNIVGLLIEAIKELKARVSELENR
jgi:hypothetical protein